MGPELAKIYYTDMQINVDKLTLTIVSLYVRPQAKISVQEWSQFFSIFKTPVFIGGDFNSHHEAWGCVNSNIQGKNLLESIDVNLNDDSFTRINPFGMHNSAIDLTIVSPIIQSSLEWSTLDDAFGSDHVHIKIVFNFSQKQTLVNRIRSRKWNTTKANWNQYYLESIVQMANLQNPTYSKYVESLNNLIEATIPQYNDHGKTKHRGKTWWNEECSQIVLDRKKCFVEYKYDPSLANLLKFKKSDARTKKLFKETKRKYWKDYCASINRNTSIRQIWSKVNCFKNRKQENTNDPWVQDFHQKLTPPFVHNAPPEILGQTLQNNLDHSLCGPFDMEELNRATKKSNNTSPGNDNIQYSMLCNLSTQAKAILLDIFNCIFNGSQPVPEDWQNILSFQ